MINHRSHFDSLGPVQQSIYRAWKSSDPLRDVWRNVFNAALPEVLVSVDNNGCAYGINRVLETGDAAMLVAIEPVLQIMDSLFTYELPDDVTLYRVDDWSHRKARNLDPSTFWIGGYVATSLDDESLAKHLKQLIEPVMFEITCTKGARACPMEGNPAAGSTLEAEILLPRNSVFVVQTQDNESAVPTITCTWNGTRPSGTA